MQSLDETKKRKNFSLRDLMLIRLKHRCRCIKKKRREQVQTTGIIALARYLCLLIFYSPYLPADPGKACFESFLRYCVLFFLFRLVEVYEKNICSPYFLSRIN